MIELNEENDKIIEIIDKNHKEKVLSFFYFTASWCGPCKKIAPTIEKLSQKLKENNKNVIIYKIDIDNNEEFAVKCNIRSVPTFLIIDGPKLLSGCSGIDFQTISNMLIEVYNKYNSIEVEKVEEVEVKVDVEGGVEVEVDVEGEIEAEVELEDLDESIVLEEDILNN